MQGTEHYWFIFSNFTYDPGQRDPNNDQILDFAKLGCYSFRRGNGRRKGELGQRDVREFKRGAGAACFGPGQAHRRLEQWGGDGHAAEVRCEAPVGRRRDEATAASTEVAGGTNSTSNQMCQWRAVARQC